MTVQEWIEKEREEWKWAQPRVKALNERHFKVMEKILHALAEETTKPVTIEEGELE